VTANADATDRRDAGTATGSADAAGDGDGRASGASGARSPSTRRGLLGALATAAATGVAGCGGRSGRSSTATATGATGATDRTPVRTATGASGPPEPLLVEASEGIYRLFSQVAGRWNANRRAEDVHEWANAVDVDPDVRVADCFARRRGVEPTGERAAPPFQVVPSRSPDIPASEALEAGDVDVAGISTPIGETLDRDTFWHNAHAEPGDGDAEAARESFHGHPVAREAVAIAVSRPVVEGGVDRLSIDEVRRLTRGEITNWRAVGGPDRAVAVVAAGDYDPPNWFQTEFGPVLPAAVASDFDPIGRLSILERRDDAITYVPLGRDGLVRPVPKAVALVTVTADGAAYRPYFRLGHASAGERARRDARPLRHADSPLVADAHWAYTEGDPDRRAAALLDLLYSPLGQDVLLDWAGFRGTRLPVPEARRRRAALRG
jgi:phosphate transport system substrate-binding protein